MSRQVNLPTPERMQVIAWHNPAVEANGHRPGSAYIEHVYVASIGPSAAWLWQRLARAAAVRPSTIVDMADLAAGLGLGTNLGSNSAMSRTVGRLVMFDCARRAGDTLAVRLALPDMAANRLARMPASVRLAHQHLASSHRPSHDTAVGQGAQIVEGVAI